MTLTMTNENSYCRLRGVAETIGFVTLKGVGVCVLIFTVDSFYN